LLAEKRQEAEQKGSYIQVDHQLSQPALRWVLKEEADQVHPGERQAQERATEPETLCLIRGRELTTREQNRWGANMQGAAQDCP